MMHGQPPAWHHPEQDGLRSLRQCVHPHSLAPGEQPDDERAELQGVQKYCKEMVEKSIKAGAGQGVFYHLCGDHGKDWPLHEDVPTPPGSLMHVAYDGLKPADLTKVAEVFGNRCALLGNVDTALIQRGTPNQVYEEAKRHVLAYKDFEKGFVAGLACECPPLAPPANVMAFMRANKEFGVLS